MSHPQPVAPKPPFEQSKAYVYACYLFLRDTWFVALHVLYPGLLLGLAYLLFTGPDQGTDLFVSFMESAGSLADEWHVGYLVQLFTDNGWVFSKFLVALAFWSFTLWYSTRVYLRAVEIDRTQAASGTGPQGPSQQPIRHRDWASILIKWLPRLLGCGPYLIGGLAFRDVHDKQHPWLLAGFYLLMAGLAGVFLLITARVERKYTKGKEYALASQDLPKSTKRVIRWTLVSIVFIFCAFTFIPREWGWATSLRPAAICVLALACWTVLGTVLIYYGYQYSIPFLGILFAGAFFFSYRNNNHYIRTLSEPEPDPVQRTTRIESDVENFRRWLGVRKPDILGQSPDSAYKVYIVAAEGGGVRAAYWAAAVLAKLDSLDPSFYRQVYGVSSVSGGSVGAVFFNSLYKDYRLSGNGPGPVSLVNKVHQMMKEDHLSGIASAMLFPDLVQRFIPFRVPGWDRARWQEDSWSEAYRKHTSDTAHPDGLNTLDESFLSQWDGGRRYQLPNLFINGTVVERGQKAILSNVSLSTTYFPDVAVLRDTIGLPVPLKTAASLSSRFPFLTPPAAIRRPGPGGKSWGQVVDGGYFENTGLSTAVEILHMVNSVLDTMRADSSLGGLLTLRKVEPVIIFIRNGDTRDKAVEIVSPMYELKSPALAFLNAWDRGSVAVSRDVAHLVERLRTKSHFVTYDLKRDSVRIPLGWLLSETASRELHKQTKNITFKHPKSK